MSASVIRKRQLCAAYENDILDVCEACIDGTLDQLKLEFEDNATVCVVLASDGYPLKYDKGLPISGLEPLTEKTMCSVSMQEPGLQKTERRS